MRIWVSLGVAALIAAPGLAQQAPTQAQTQPPLPTQAPAPAIPGQPQAAPMQQQVPMVQPIPLPPPVVLPTLTPAQAALLRQLVADDAVAHGLHHGSDLPPLPTENDALVRAVLDHARAVHSGRLDAVDFQEDWGLRPAPWDPLPGLVDALRRDRLIAWINSLPPPYAGYEALKTELAAYREIEAAGGWEAIPAGPDLKLGAAGPRVAALRKRLAFEDASVAAEGDGFDAALQEAVRRAQRRYGLNPTGTVSTQTLARLNVSAGDRVRQIMANMERWRWLPREMPVNRIQVNIAAAVVTVFEGDAPVLSMKGVTGKPGDETPMLSSSIHSIVINPPWNVPAGIAARELFPKGAAYLARNGFKVIGEGPNRRLQQQPSHSALGKYKFDFDNPYAVYLHDTPSQSTFSRYDRLASHGCIRLEKPAELARLLLREDPEWTPEKIQATVDAGKTVRVPLKVQPQVFLLYWTGFASSDGGMNFRADPYGWDKLLAEKIEARAVTQAAETIAR